MFIILDTNILLSDLVLTSPTGAAVRFYIQQQGATVAIPEVVRVELERNLKRRLVALAKETEANHRQLLSVFGSLKELVLPPAEEIEKKAAEILSGLDVPTRDIPFSLESARSSFLKTVDKVPPSDGQQQFKDGVIWADCVALLAEEDVYLITQDKAFFESRDYSQGLAQNLAQETEASDHSLKIFHSLDALLEDIRVNIQIDEANLLEALRRTWSDSIDGLLEHYGFVIGEPARIDVKLFATTAADQLTVGFEIIFQCEDSTTQARSNAALTLEGEGSYDAQTEEHSELRLHSLMLTYTDEEGDQQKGSVFGTAQSFLGHRTVHHEVKPAL